LRENGRNGPFRYRKVFFRLGRNEDSMFSLKGRFSYDIPPRPSLGRQFFTRSSPRNGNGNGRRRPLHKITLLLVRPLAVSVPGVPFPRPFFTATYVEERARPSLRGAWIFFLLRLCSACTSARRHPLLVVLIPSPRVRTIRTRQRGAFALTILATRLIERGNAVRTTGIIKLTRAKALCLSSTVARSIERRTPMNLSTECSAIGDSQASLETSPEVSAFVAAKPPLSMRRKEKSPAPMMSCAHVCMRVCARVSFQILTMFGGGGVINIAIYRAG